MSYISLYGKFWSNFKISVITCICQLECSKLCVPIIYYFFFIFIFESDQSYLHMKLTNNVCGYNILVQLFILIFENFKINMLNSIWNFDDLFIYFYTLITCALNLKLKFKMSFMVYETIVFLVEFFGPYFEVQLQ